MFPITPQDNQLICVGQDNYPTHIPRLSLGLISAPACRVGGKTIISSNAIIRGDLRRTGPGHAVVISLGRYCLIGEGCIMRYVYWHALFETSLLRRFHVKASIQDISREFQLLPYEDWGPRTYRWGDCCGSRNHWKPRSDWEQLCHCTHSGRMVYRIISLRYL